MYVVIEERSLVAQMRVAARFEPPFRKVIEYSVLDISWETDRFENETKRSEAAKK